MRPGAFSATLGVVLVVSMLPTGWVSPWSSRAAELVGLPLVPLGDGLRAVRSWLVPSAERVLTGQEAELLEDQARQLRQQRDEARLQARDLERRLARYEGEDPSRVRGVRFLDARIVGTTPFPSGENWYRINAGAARGVMPGAQIVVRKDVLLGHVVPPTGGEGGRTVSLVRPLTSTQTSRFQGRILFGSEDDMLAGELGSVEGFLTPDGTGWTTTVTERDGAAVRPGHQVEIVDDTLGDALAFRVGRVESVQPDPGNPLWLRVRVEPLADLDDLREIEVRIPVVETIEETGS